MKELDDDESKRMCERILQGNGWMGGPILPPEDGRYEARLVHLEQVVARTIRLSVVSMLLSVFSLGIAVGLAALRFR